MAAMQLPAQSVGINATGTSPDPSAMLDVESTTQGMLVPRMTSLQRSAISSPATGLLVYDTDTQSFWFHAASGWTELVAGNLDRLADADGNTQIQVEEGPNDNTIRFDVDGNEAMVLDPDGDLGLGTASPQAALHLEDGQVLMRGDYVFNYSGAIPDSGAGTRLMWVPQKAAFRVGYVNGTQWDLDSIGAYSSVAGGVNNTASGFTSAVGGGRDNAASDFYSFVGGGFDNSASEDFSFVGGGRDNAASGERSFVGGGQANTASQIWSFIGGGAGNTASGESSFVGGGSDNIASGSYSFVGGGDYNIASGHYSFVGGGDFNTASGHYSFVGGGEYNQAASYGEAVLGFNAETYTPQSTTTFDAADRLFVVGNGTDSSARSNAMTLYKGGQLVFKGDYVPGYSGDLPATGAGTRLMWVPQKAAFRVGNVTGTQWNQASVGVYSTVTGGRDNIASALYSTVGGGKDNKAEGNESTVSGGDNNSASNIGSTVSGGVGNLASGDYAFVGGGRDHEASALYSTVGGGKDNTAEGNESYVGGGERNWAQGDGSVIAGGSDNRVLGNYSTILGGENLLAQSYGEIMLGTYNDYASNPSATSFVATDRLFVIGNGTADNARSNALTMLKNGNTVLGGNDPGGYRLKVVQTGAYGIDLENTNGDDWEWWVRGDAYLGLYHNGLKGTFDDASGIYTALSDARLKTAIVAMPSVMDRVMQLRPSQYQYKQDAQGRQYLGFLAQEVEPLFPELVRRPDPNSERESYYTLDYSGFGIVAIKAVQEQQQLIEAQQAEIEALKTEVEQLRSLEARLSQLEASLNN